MAKNDKKFLSGVGQRLKQLVPSKLKKQEETQPDLTLQPREQEAISKPVKKSTPQVTKKKTKKHAGKRRKK